jgi:hypothetical protein
MKINIGPYPNWWGSYQIAEKIFFWIPKYDENYSRTEQYKEYPEALGKWLSKTWFNDLLVWIHSKQKRKVKIKIDRYDSWNAHNTASIILLPLFKQLYETNHGCFLVADEDVPEKLTSKFAVSQEHGWDSSNVDRYNYVMQEILFALESDNCDWEEKYYVDFPNGEQKADNLGLGIMTDRDYSKTDYDGMRKEQERISNGFRLMGKYWQGLWD